MVETAARTLRVERNRGSTAPPSYRCRDSKASITGVRKAGGTRGQGKGQENHKSEKLRELPLWGAFEVCFCLKLSERQKEKS